MRVQRQPCSLELALALGQRGTGQGTALDIDPANGHIKNSKEAMKLWKREYRKGWEPKV
jgi:hypothetical protein